MSKRKKKAPPVIHTLLGIRIHRFNARIESNLNHEIHDKKCRWEETPIYRFYSHIELMGLCVYPDDRADENYGIWVYGDDTGQRKLGSRLEDFKERDKYGSPTYRRVRGQSEPIYHLPKGIGNLEKYHGNWRGGAFLPPSTVSDMLSLLPHIRPIYLAIHEAKEGRHRFIVGMGLQTVHPSLE